MYCVAGQIKRLLDTIIEQRSRGNPTIALTTKTKIVLKGVSVDRFTAASPDDPTVLAKVRAIAAEMGVKI